ncbi:MAG: Gfo/Idh/MocA family oxidoreductase [Deltaproteobacteria bacterium]|nr:Gfo/Idh/MocA family oxidoreductase [Deltaproteobacteria bacterium]
MTNTKIIVLIPARGGSKSIPRKNIKMLAGKPMIAYSIEEARKCPEVERVIVSTDDEEIAKVAKQYGAEVPFLRPKELAEDHVQDLPVFLHCLQWLQENENYIPDIVIQLRPTSPLRQATHIQEALKIFLKNQKADCVRSVTLASEHPLKMWRLEDCSLIPFTPENAYGIRESYNYPRQKLPGAYTQNGSVEIIRAKSILEKKSLSGDRILGYVMPEEVSVNIDSPLDFELAELLLKKRNEAMTLGNRPIRKVKILGAGSIGNHLAQAARRMGWDVTLCDVDPEALRRTQASIYPSRYGQWDKGIQLCTVAEAPRGGFDMIFLGTPPDIRMKIAIDCLEESPRLIQLEKPVCPPSLEGAQAFFEKAKKKGVAVCVGFDHVLGENTLQVEKLLSEEIIGKIETLDVEFREYWGGIFAAHPWLPSISSSYLGFWKKGGGASGEHSHATNLWQHFAHCLGAGRISEVTAVIDFSQKDGADYDRLASLSVKTEKGLLGRIIQDVVTRPPRKWARIQGNKAAIEWVCGWKPSEDAVFCYSETGDKSEILIPKKRPDDFFREMLHFERLLTGELKPESSPISLQRGLDTALVISAAHRSHRERRMVKIDYSKGYCTEAIS